MPIPQVLSWSEDLEYHVVSATASEIREKIPGAGRITVSMDAFARENPIVPPATRRYFADKFVTEFLEENPSLSDQGYLSNFGESTNVFHHGNDIDYGAILSDYDRPYRGSKSSKGSKSRKGGSKGKSKGSKGNKVGSKGGKSNKSSSGAGFLKNYLTEYVYYAAPSVKGPLNPVPTVASLQSSSPTPVPAATIAQNSTFNSSQPIQPAGGNLSTTVPSNRSATVPSPSPASLRQPYHQDYRSSSGFLSAGEILAGIMNSSTPYSAPLPSPTFDHGNKFAGNSSILEDDSNNRKQPSAAPIQSPENADISSSNTMAQSSSAKATPRVRDGLIFALLAAAGLFT